MAGENDEEVNIEFDVNDDKVAPKLSRMEKGVLKLGNAVDRASHRFTGLAGAAVGIGGLLALGPAIQGAKDYINHLDKISDLTGIAADRVGGISNALQSSGVHAGTVENVFGRLVKKGAQLGEGQKSLVKMAKRYGVEMKEGPEEAILGVAKLLEKGKINAGQMQRILGVSSDDAADLADALSQGPEALKRKIEEATKKNAAFNDEAMNGMQRYQNATAGVKVAWQRLTASVLIRLAPALEKITTKVEMSIDRWSAGAGKFADFMVNHMDTLISMAKTYAKIMFANRLMMGVTGKGIIPNVMSLSKGAGRAGGFIAGGVKNIIGRGFGGNISGIISLLSRFFTGAVALRPIIMGLGRLTIVGTVILAIVGIMKKMEDKSSKIGAAMHRIFAVIERIGDTLSRMFSGDSALGRLAEWLGGALLDGVESLLSAFARFLEVVEAVVETLSVAGEAFWEGKSMYAVRSERRSAAAQKRLAESGFGEYTTPGAKQAALQRLAKSAMAGKGKVTAADRAAFAEYEKAFKAYGGPETEIFKKMKARFGPEAKAPQMNVYQDFRNSRFDITQAFAEGYDPDRIAVAFANDISSLGEKKLQSGFSPLFAVR